MGRLILTLAILMVSLNAGARVRTGIEVLRDRGFDAVSGKNIGLVTNATGVDAMLTSTIDILHSAPGVRLKALFGPEHGVRGDVAAGASVASGRDALTGLPVYSLYGPSKKPSSASLKGLDALVYDIQDIGCRSYTFISTLSILLQTCADSGLELIVLDRPNPLGGIRVEGPRQIDDDCRSFVSRSDIPYIYGLTPGELARWLNHSELSGRCRLTVVEMEGWRRDMTFADTGLPWVPTSPNIPSATTAMYYPAMGIMGELGTVSIGANYTMPFRVALRKSVNADSLSRALNSLQLPGTRFRPCHMKPQGKPMHGVEVYFLHPDSATLTLTQFYILQELIRLRPADNPFKTATAYSLSMFDKVCGSKSVRREFCRRYMAEDILGKWQADVVSWRRDVRPFMLYK